MSDSHKKRKGIQFGLVAAVLLFIVLSPLIVIALTFHILAGLLLNVAVWCCWCLRGRYVLFVHSDSPIWRDYVENHILPRLGERAVVLNWSHRSKWRPTLSVLAFRYFGGRRCFNPMALVFRPFRLARRFRFYEPFQDFKHGKTAPVARMETELYGMVDQISRARP